MLTLISEINNSLIYQALFIYKVLCCHPLVLVSCHKMRTFNGVQNGDSERLSNVPKVTQPWSGQLLGGGEWKANWGPEDGEKISQQFTGNALWNWHFFSCLN